MQERQNISELNVLAWTDSNNTQWLGNTLLKSSLSASDSNELTLWGDSFTNNVNIVFHSDYSLGTSWLGYIDALTGAKASWSQETDFNTTSNSLFVLADNTASSFNRTLLDSVEKSTQDTLKQWFQKDDVLAQLAVPFSANANTPEWAANALALRDSILEGSYHVRLEVRSGAEMNGLLGAFRRHNQSSHALP